MERTLRLDLFVPTPLWVLGKTLNYYCFFTAVIARQCYVAWHSVEAVEFPFEFDSHMVVVVAIDQP